MNPSIPVSQYQTWVRNKLGDQSFDGATLIQFAYDVNKQVCNSYPWPFMEKVFEGTIDTAHFSYDFPTGCQVPVSIVLVGNNNSPLYLNYIPYVQYNEQYPDPTTVGPSTPTVWTTFANTFKIGPSLPDQAYTLQMEYIASPDAYSTDTTKVLNIPDDFAEVIVLGMYIRALKVNDNFDQAQVEQQEFEQQIGTMKTRLLTRTYGEPTRMWTGRKPASDY